MTTQVVFTRQVQRRDTAANWTAVNPVLLSGEWGLETDTRKLKIGDGVTAWNALAYNGGTPGGPGDPTNLSVINRTAAGLTIASSTGGDADVPLATENLAGLQAPSNRAKAEGAVQEGDARLSNAREWSAATVDQPTAEAGSSTARFAYTPQRVFQAIAAWWLASAANAKLNGIASGATANATNEQLRDRSTHTGTQPASTITGLGTAATANTGDFATSAQGALAATAVQPPGLASTLAAYLTTASAASSYQPLSANLTALAANNAAYYLARSNHSGTQALSTISGLGTGIANALAANAGAAGAPVLFDGAGGTPSSLTLTNATGLPFGAGISDKPTTLVGYGITDGFTEAQVRATPITGFTAGAGTVSDSDSILQAFQKVVGNAHSAVTAVTHGSNASTARPSGVTAVYWIGTVEPVNAVNGDLWMGGI
jgi:hypothetical protein